MEILYNQKIVKENLLYNFGVELQDVSSCYQDLWNNIRKIFLTDTNRQWFGKRFEQALHNADKQAIKEVSVAPHENSWLLWELFSFRKLPHEKGQKAIEKFDSFRFQKCYVVQVPVWNDGDVHPKAYALYGQYDMSYITNKEDFETLKKDIAGKGFVRFGAIDYLAQHIGKEVYVADINWRYIVTLTHENEIYGYDNQSTL